MNEKFLYELDEAVFKVEAAIAILKFVTQGLDGLAMDFNEKTQYSAAIWGAIRHLEAVSDKLSAYV